MSRGRSKRAVGWLATLRAYAVAALGDDDGADSVVAEAVAKFAESVELLEWNDRTELWVFQILRNRIVDRLRGSPPRGVRSTDDEDGASIAIDTCLRGFLSDLSELEREAVELVDYERLSVRNAARRLRILPDECADLLAAGRRTVRASFAADCATVIALGA